LTFHDFDLSKLFILIDILSLAAISFNPGRRAPMKKTEKQVCKKQARRPFSRVKAVDTPNKLSLLSPLASPPFLNFFTAFFKVVFAVMQFLLLHRPL
jgi:hypothetical protein